MMTGRGTALDPAPRTAYELAACVAAGDDAAVARLWARLDDAARARVAAALGAQARHAAWQAAGAGGVLRDLLAEQVTDLLGDLPNCEARIAAVHALDGRPDAALPACDGCPRPAIALARARLRLISAYGLRPAARR